MRVTVKLFARLREIAGADTLQRDVATDSTVADLWRALTADFPGFSAFESTISAAVNAEYTRPTRALADGDEVAFLPPVSGG